MQSRSDQADPMLQPTFLEDFPQYILSRCRIKVKTSLFANIVLPNSTVFANIEIQNIKYRCQTFLAVLFMKNVVKWLVLCFCSYGLLLEHEIETIFLFKDSLLVYE